MGYTKQRKKYRNISLQEDPAFRFPYDKKVFYIINKLLSSARFYQLNIVK